MSENKKNYGSGGNCICISCNILIPHIDGKPCKQSRCPNCGKIMLRENSEHHQKFLNKRIKD